MPISPPISVDLTKLERRETEVGFPSSPSLDEIAVTDATYTTEVEISFSLPLNATITKASLIAIITALNNTSNLQKIGVAIYGRPSQGAWFGPYFNKSNCIGLPAQEGATTILITVQDISNLVTQTGTYGFRAKITQSSANSVRYTIQYVLIITYRVAD